MWLIVVCAIVGIVRVLLPYILSWLGIAGDVVMKVLNILLVAFVLIVLVYFVFDLLSCAGGMRVR